MQRRHRQLFLLPAERLAGSARSRVERPQRRAVTRLTEGAQAMVAHGKGPKDVLYREYGRWQRGRYQRIPSGIRGSGNKLGYRQSRKQLKFGFEQPGAAR
jgi:hypothetical protein